MDLRSIKVDMSGFDRSGVVEVNRICLAPAGCALDIVDGSERGEYVSQDYILHKLGRPHRCVGLMYTYYPKEKTWPKRSSEAYADMEVDDQWKYPYDDYFTYGGGLQGDIDAKVFQQIRDIRKHGQDVVLTLTVDCSLEDEYLVAIAKDLRPFGRMNIRINHECAGRWFTHNRRYTYKEVADFFVRFHKIIKKYAPNVSTIFCSGFVTEDGRMEQEDSFYEAFRTADIWSADKYIALHYGWPFDICEKGGHTHTAYTVENYIETVQITTKRLTEINDGKRKPFTASEFNADGDVTGPIAQGCPLLRFADYLNKERPEWYDSMAMYQFRDRGRLGLEIEDPNNSAVGIEQPLMDDYKKVMRMEYFQPAVQLLECIYKDEGQYFILNEGQIDSRNDSQDDSRNDSQDIGNEYCLLDRVSECGYLLRWGSAEDSEGIEMKMRLEGVPVFFDIELPEGANLMIDVNGRWFYKAPGVRIIDAMPAFFEKGAAPVSAGDIINIRLFAPPVDGENPDTGAKDWAENYYYNLSVLPRFRIRYEPCAELG